MIRVGHGGSGRMYEYGCRCDICRAAHNARINRRRRERDPADYTGEHGKPSTYVNWNCRCDLCREAWSEVNRIRYQRRKANGQSG